jgi:IS30 family transposase
LSRSGDREADIIIAQNHRHAIVCIDERQAKLCLIERIGRNTAGAVGQAVSTLLRPVEEKCHTIASVNGRGFANHQQIARSSSRPFLFRSPVFFIGARAE